MKKLALAAIVVVAFTVSSAVAGTCPGSGCGDKGKSDKKKEGTTTQTVTPAGFNL